jgi:hypothetical protein
MSTANSLPFVVGSKNDHLLKELISDDWKKKTGVEQPMVKKGAVPGYDFPAYWKNVMAEQRELEAAGGGGL